MTKTCLDCGGTKPLEAFAADRTRRDGRHPYCAPCKRVRYTRWYSRGANADRVKARATAHTLATYRKLRDEIHALLGGCCANCGTSQDLQIDHVHNDGAAHRSQVGTGTRMLRDIRGSIQRGERRRFQLLCGKHNREKALA